MPYHFTQPCPTCGRHMRIPVGLLGRDVACQHCGAEFVGGCEEDTSTPQMTIPLLDRVDEILRRTETTVTVQPK